MKLIIILLFFVACSGVKVTKEINHQQKSVFEHKSTISWVRTVKECSNALVRDELFANELKAKTKFAFTDDDGETVYKKMLNHNCMIRTYKTKNPFSKVQATTYKSNTVDLYLNLRKNNSVFAWTGTAHHECSHNYGYGHGTNKRSDNWEMKKESVPYWLGALATKHAKRVCK